MKTYANIQALRAVAASAVVWTHLRELLPADGVIAMLPSGIAGVDLFFVISGFLMVTSTEAKTISPARFLIDRFTRVAPLYYLFTLLVFALGVIAPWLFKSSSGDAAALALSILFVPAFDSPGRIYPVYHLGWTLNYEAMFYVLFALGLSIGARWRHAFVIGVVCLLASAGAAFDLSGGSAAVYAATRPIVLDFSLGIGIAIFVPRWAEKNRLPAGVALTLLGLGIAGILFAGSLMPRSPGTPAMLPITDTVWRHGIWAALVVASCIALEHRAKAVKNRFVLRVGNASYSLYLAHFFPIALANEACNEFNLEGEHRIAVAFATFVACIGAGLLCHHLIEKPLTRWFRPERPTRAASTSRKEPSGSAPSLAPISPF